MHSKREVISYGSLTAFEDTHKNIAMPFALHGLPITAAFVCIVFQKVYNICQTSEVKFPIFNQLRIILEGF